MATLVCSVIVAVLVGAGQGPASAAEGDLVPILLQDVRAGNASSTPQKFVQVGTNVLFLALDATVGNEWRKTDGTPGGTSLVKDIRPGTANGAGSTGNQPVPAVLGGSVFFVGNDGLNGNELWKSDGTEAGTVMVKDINVGTSTTSGVGSTEFKAVGGSVFFVANSGTTGTELWKTDGSEAGTVLVKDINGGTAASSSTNLTDVGGTLFFTSNNGANGTELWKSDGTEPGTVLVADIRTGTTSSSPTNLTAAGGTLFFTVNDGVNGNELWKSDGTGPGTMLIEDINPGSGAAVTTSFATSPLVVAHGTSVFFAATDGVNGTELWKSDGTAPGTLMVKDINPGAANGLNNGPHLVPFGSMLLLAGIEAATGSEPWISDGTEAGTVLLKDINPGTAVSSAGLFAVVGSTAYFRASDGSVAPAVGTELWKTDGTPAGTALAADINPGTDIDSTTQRGSAPDNLTPALGTLFLSAGTFDTGREPYALRANFSPVAGADAYSTSENTPLTVAAPGVLGTDTDPDGDTLTAGSASPPANGSVTLNTNGSFTYTPAAAFVGTDSFTYAASDGLGGSATGTVTVTVNANQAPSAVDDTATTAEDTPVTVNAPGVLGNDTDPENGTLTAGSASDPASGSVTLNADGSYTYTPDADFTGSDSFTYQANDGNSDSNTATVNVTVTPVNDPPVADDDAYSGTAGSTLTVAAPGVLGNDADLDGDALSAGAASDPANGSVVLNADGSFTYTTDLGGYSGSDSFTYDVSDGQGGTDTATVTITITPNPAPTTVSVADLSIAEGGTGTTTGNFTITRSGNATGTSTVKYRTSGGTATAGTDYTGPVPLTVLTFAPFETAKTVSVDVAGDTLPERDETFNLVLSAPTGAAIADATGVATIRNDDGSAYVAVDSVTVTEGNAGPTAAAFTITRSGNTDGASTVTYKTSGGNAVAGTDYTTVAATPVTFTAGEDTKTVNVDVTGDLTAENNETFNLVLSAPSVGTVLVDASGAGTIVDDEGPVTAGPSTFLSVNNLSVNEGSSGTTAASFTVTRSGNTSGPSTVKYKTSGGTATAGTDYAGQVTLAPLSFAAGQSTQTVTVDVTGDTAPEKDETFNLVLSAPTGATIADASGTATIVNDDGAAYLTVGNISVTEGNAGPTTATFTITRTGNTGGASTVKYKTTDGTAKVAGGDYSAVVLTTVTFAAGQATHTVTVDVTGDTTTEGNETFNLVVSAPSAGTVISDAAGTATITNDD